MNIQVFWDRERCVHCLHCIEVCPSKAIEDAEEQIKGTPACTGCGSCAAACPGKALSLAGHVYTPQEILDICLEDQAFYEESGGGVTLTGGEVLSQSAFAEELLVLLGKAGMHRAIETCGFTALEAFKKLIHETELILFDVKHYDREKHLHFTGVYNDQIIENLQFARNQGCQVLPRLPVIPGCNDRLEDAAGFAELFLSLGIEEVQLLPFHQFGQNKYALLGMGYTLDHVKSLHAEDLQSFQDILATKGIRAFF
jgi:pyruvate formate lyase activating enzyme